MVDAQTEPNLADKDLRLIFPNRFATTFDSGIVISSDLKGGSLLRVQAAG